MRKYASLFLSYGAAILLILGIRYCLHLPISWKQPVMVGIAAAMVHQLLRFLFNASRSTIRKFYPEDTPKTMEAARELYGTDRGKRTYFIGTIIFWIGDLIAGAMAGAFASTLLYTNNAFYIGMLGAAFFTANNTYEIWKELNEVA